MKLGRLTDKNIEKKLNRMRGAQAYQIASRPLLLRIFIDEYEDGVSKENLARKFGVTVAAIVTLLEMLGYTNIFSGFVLPLLRSIFASGVIEVVTK